MSRCFPYPPPGYEKDEPLPIIEDSIKLQRESEKTKKERRKEKKREKKERKENKKKEKSREDSELENKKHSQKQRSKDEGGKIDQKGRDHPKRREDESEQLEKSGLTEEHGQPASTQNLSDSSDSSQDSRKRKKHELAPVGSHNLGNVLRFRLPLSKHTDKDFEVPPSKVQSCSTSGRPEIVTQKKIDITPRSVSSQLCSTPGRAEILAQDKAEAAAVRTCSSGSRSSLDVEGTQYRDLIENWIPPPLQMECSDFDDQDWLFDTKLRPHGQEAAKRFKASEEDAEWPGRRRSSTSRLWPTACFLAEADIYALPYTVPY
ncbi:hypothetical protein BVC80_1689g17 [Macleaya cordata]|uniref:Uncharacterized protein n=1 Tax=Macleaya cordata TaxID=56857 RepID=A0A200RAT2_MACCD|nr:hypothetical protein BVC80_1689g17 [Macleaya cordata]